MADLDFYVIYTEVGPAWWTGDDPSEWTASLHAYLTPIQCFFINPIRHVFKQ